jgi:hypothetical protein
LAATRHRTLLAFSIATLALLPACPTLRAQQPDPLRRRAGAARQSRKQAIEAIAALRGRIADASARQVALAEARSCITLLDMGLDPRAARAMPTFELVSRVEIATVALACREMQLRLRVAPDDANIPRSIEWITAQQQADGGWGFGPGHPYTANDETWTDMDHTLSALEALSRAARAGAEVDQDVWIGALNWLADAVNDDGGWGYQGRRSGKLRLRGQSHGSATAGGVLALLAVAPHARDDRLAPLLAGGIDWLEKHKTVQDNPGYIWGDDWLEYCLWLERLGQLNRLIALGGPTLSSRLFEQLHDAQMDDGSYPPPARRLDPRLTLQATCRAALAMRSVTAPAASAFLIRPARLSIPGRAAWVREVSDALDRPITFAMATETDLPPAPLLILPAGDTDRLDAKQAEALKALVDQALDNGRILLILADRADLSRSAPGRIVRESAKARHWVKGQAGTDHPARRLRRDCPGPLQMPIRTFSDGAWDRIFVVAQHRPGADLTANLIAYATDQQELTWPLWPPREHLAEASATRSLTVARVRHSGSWNVAADVMASLHRVLTQAQSVGIETTEAVDLTRAPAADVLWLSLQGDLELTDTHRGVLEAYLKGGGMLVADSSAGTGEGIEALAKTLQTMMGPGSTSILSADHPLITGGFAGGAGSDLRDIRWRRAMRNAPNKPDVPQLIGVEHGGRLVAVLTPHAVTAAADGPAIYGLKGPVVDDARRMAANLLLYTLYRPERP